MASFELFKMLMMTCANSFSYPYISTSLCVFAGIEMSMLIKASFMNVFVLSEFE